MSNQLLGAYTPYTSDISKEAKEAFAQALKGFVGVEYSPVAVSTQLVSGMNYKFFCNTQAVNVLPAKGAAIVSIYSPLDAPAHITHIQNL